MATSIIPDDPTTQVIDNPQVTNQGATPGTPAGGATELSDEQIDGMSIAEVQAYISGKTVPDRFNSAPAAAAPGDDLAEDPTSTSAADASPASEGDEPAESAKPEARNHRFRKEDFATESDWEVALYAKQNKVSLAAAATILGVTQSPAALAADAPAVEEPETSGVLSTAEEYQEAQSATARAKEEIRAASKTYDEARKAEAAIALADAQKVELKLEAKMEIERQAQVKLETELNANIALMQERFPSMKDLTGPAYKEYKMQLAYTESYEPELLDNPQYPLILAGRAMDRLSPTKAPIVPPQPAPRTAAPVTPSGVISPEPGITRAQLEKRMDDPKVTSEELTKIARQLAELRANESRQGVR